jgi:hypothetical protein
MSSKINKVTIPSKPAHDTLTRQLTDLISRLPADRGFSNWQNIPEIRDAYKLLSDKELTNIKKRLSKPTGKGRGIVIPGGGTKYFPSMWVGINRLRQVGCQLPIEVWYLGNMEMDSSMKRLLEPLDTSDAYP